MHCWDGSQPTLETSEIWKGVQRTNRKHEMLHNYKAHYRNKVTNIERHLNWRSSATYSRCVKSLHRIINFKLLQWHEGSTHRRPWRITDRCRRPCLLSGAARSSQTIVGPTKYTKDTKTTTPVWPAVLHFLCRLCTMYLQCGRWSQQQKVNSKIWLPLVRFCQLPLIGSMLSFLLKCLPLLRTTHNVCHCQRLLKFTKAFTIFDGVIRDIVDGSRITTAYSPVLGHPLLYRKW
jgi:hypothetical protein